ncbi:MarR family winged helix-turn-helix transcriptional regulator [Pseudohoeflea coraliihabitans]|uniref:MarR family transcriptional regulator n=1 Tax=Pseudohoeflea coraliihabitans TaxID=2860393 RepID=A0ABS6WQH3_9HYPH|nr:MarR family transcriptional regulator [Pseudohoeflea sp. DP4N28-3]MBW3098015.1 MarR family transcriptional regulator [Pseudohoeflea sp. DP4N28-3]
MNKNQALPWDNPRFRNWVAVARACQVMGLTLARALQGLDLKPPHLDILANIYRHPDISQQELAHKLLVGRSNLSMLLPQLEQRGLVARAIDPADRRVLRLALTPAGRSLTEEALAIQTAVIERSMATASIEECDLVGDVMQRLIAALTQGNDDDGGEANQA